MHSTLKCVDDGLRGMRGYPRRSRRRLFGHCGVSIVANIEEAIQVVVGQSEKTQNRFIELGILPDVMVGDEFADQLQKDIATMKDVVEKAGIPPLD